MCARASRGPARATTPTVRANTTRRFVRRRWRATRPRAFHASSALGRLQQSLDLTQFETELLVLCAAVELDARVAQLLSSGFGQTPHVSFALALSCLDNAHWSALSPGAPLRYWACLELRGTSSVRGDLIIDERVLSFLLGVADIDRRLQERAQPLRDSDSLPASQRSVAVNAARLWSQPGASGFEVIAYEGPEADDRRRVALAAARTSGRQCHVMKAADVPADPVQHRRLQRLWEREAAMRPVCVLIELDDMDSDAVVRDAISFAVACQCPVALSARRRLRGDRAVHWLHVPLPGSSEQDALWRAALGDAESAHLAQLPRVLAQFDFGAATIERVAFAATHGARGESLWRLCRRRAQPRLAGLAQRIESRVGWDDLVLPTREAGALRQIVGQVRNRHTVYDGWRMAEGTSRGRGVTALFAGPSGTGKTLAAEVIANELELDLYRVDLSGVVSKYIGETEKNLARIFDAADGGGVILLFDEADALFGERSQVSDSHDRYANIEIAYLLQRMESFSGLSILTTNIRDAIDQAFHRRLRFLIDFPFPDRALRQAMWEQAFPPDGVGEALDAERLAQLNVAGGTIRNIALNAAFIAADSAQPVRMAHLYEATSLEYAKMNRLLSTAETEGWA